MATDEHQLAALGARRIATDTDPSDLVLPGESKRRLEWIMAWLSQPPLVFREWGLSRFVDGGLRALFAGPSGTGKTMAAVVVAKYADLQLYRIDLGAVVSKYIGETEKNLQRVIETATGEGAVLLFDEADALFARRSEVKDSHDRYANVDVGYLLQKIEAFEGLAILATNLASDIDEAALTRIDVMVEFPRPDEAAREEIWRNLLHAMKMFRSDRLDERALAKAYELSGAEILRAVRMAALLAASADKPLDMELLKSAAEERIAMRGGAKGRSLR
jgi:SpoVK/Ycf46/Vps4 family AAA+-type ATPase